MSTSDHLPPADERVQVLSDEATPWGWRVEHRRGSAQALHLAEVDHRDPLVVLNEVTGAALVLGSSQDEGDVELGQLAREGVQLARRRSGGGAVLLLPGAQTWIDVVLPAGDRRWRDDVEQASWWLGEAWADLLVAVVPGAEPTVRHVGLSDRAAGRVACFAASGPGEVLFGDRKTVGISQRRTRTHARFQCVVHHRWDAEATLGLLDPSVWPLVEHALRHHVAAVAQLDELGGPHGWGVVEELLAHLG